MILRLTLLSLLLLAMIGSACKPGPTPTPTPTRTPIATSTPTAVPPATTTPSPAATERPAFFLKVVTPQNESIVTTASIEVTGETTPDAAVSVNSQFVEVDGAGMFKTVVTLLPGANTIDVVASDFTGRRASAEVLTVLYIP